MLVQYGKKEKKVIISINISKVNRKFDKYIFYSEDWTKDLGTSVAHEKKYYFTIYIISKKIVLYNSSCQVLPNKQQQNHYQAVTGFKNRLNIFIATDIIHRNTKG